MPVLTHRSVHLSDWCRSCQIYHQFVTYRLKDLKSVTKDLIGSVLSVQSVESNVKERDQTYSKEFHYTS